MLTGSCGRRDDAGQLEKIGQPNWPAQLASPCLPHMEFHVWGSSMEFDHACHVRDRGYSCLLAMFPMCVMFESWFRLPPWTCMPVMGVPNSCNINTSPLSDPTQECQRRKMSPLISETFKKEVKKFVKNLMEESDPKALSLQDVREAVKKRVVEGRRTQKCGNVQCHCRFHRFTFSPQG